VLERCVDSGATERIFISDILSKILQSRMCHCLDKALHRLFPDSRSRFYAARAAAIYGGHASAHVVIDETVQFATLEQARQTYGPPTTKDPPAHPDYQYWSGYLGGVTEFRVSPGPNVYVVVVDLDRCVGAHHDPSTTPPDPCLMGLLGGGATPVQHEVVRAYSATLAVMIPQLCSFTTQRVALESMMEQAASAALQGSSSRQLIMLVIALVARGACVEPDLNQTRVGGEPIPEPLLVTILYYVLVDGCDFEELPVLLQNVIPRTHSKIKLCGARARMIADLHENTFWDWLGEDTFLSLLGNEVKVQAAIQGRRQRQGEWERDGRPTAYHTPTTRRQSSAPLAVRRRSARNQNLEAKAAARESAGGWGWNAS